MKEIDFHIAYMLTKHECVIIPGFGAFVVSRIPASRKEIQGGFTPPTQFLGFNPEIKHNDGLLASSYSVIKNISYEEADAIVRKYSDRLYKQLYDYKYVNIKWLGKLSLSLGNKIIFEPDVNLSCNAINFGLDTLVLPYLKDLKKHDKNNSTEKNKEVITISFSRKILVPARAAAAAIVALCLSSAPLNNSSRYTQNASFFTGFYKFEAQKSKNDNIVQDSVATETDTLHNTPITEQPVVEKANTGNYYIIIASLATRSIAEDNLPDFKRNGFPQASIISKGNRHRIYIERFEEKKEAESYLQVFRRNNQQYSDAWLLYHAEK
jgi:nucleoid DNA-binding protein